VVEELASIKSAWHNNRRIVFECETMKELELPWTKLNKVITDGALRANTVKSEYNLKVVVSAVKSASSLGLNHCQFQPSVIN
jgi:hypothetical protein